MPRIYNAYNDQHIITSSSLSSFLSLVSLLSNLSPRRRPRCSLSPAPSSAPSSPSLPSFTPASAPNPPISTFSRKRCTHPSTIPSTRSGPGRTVPVRAKHQFFPLAYSLATLTQANQVSQSPSPSPVVVAHSAKDHVPVASCLVFRRVSIQVLRVRRLQSVEDLMTVFEVRV